MVKKICFILFLIFPLSVFAKMPSALEIGSTISSDEIRDHLKYLTSHALEGRRTATRGERKAGDYIAGEFRKYGLLPGGENKTYFQKFPLTVGRKAQGSLQVFRGAGKAMSLKRGTHYDIQGYSSSGNFDGSLVFCGYGLKTRTYNHYHSASVKGKIALVVAGIPQGFAKKIPRRYRSYYGSPLFKAVIARKQGAKALLIAVPKIGGEYQFKSLPGRRTMEIPIFYISYKMVEKIWPSKMKFSFRVSGLQSTKRFRPMELEARVQGRVKVELIKGFGRNIVGYIQGSDPILSREVVVLGAHYDHLGWGGRGSLAPGKRAIHPGADDNGSGSAVLMEVAEALSILDGALQRTYVFVAFSGEEEGLLGSSYYASHPRFPIKNTLAMLNMDMVGRLKNNKLIVMGGGTAKEWDSIVQECNQSLGLKLNMKSRSGYGPSDHTSFYKHRVPVLHFFTGLHKDYHKPSDTADKINYLGAVKVGRLVFYTALALEEHPDGLTYIKVQPPKRRGRRGLRPYLGVIPEYGEGDKSGLKISGVGGGSPADKAGLKTGDVIVHFGKDKIKNIYDLTQGLYNHKPGEKVAVVVIRKGKKITLTVTLGRR